MKIHIAKIPEIIPGSEKWRKCFDRYESEEVVSVVEKRESKSSRLRQSSIFFSYLRKISRRR